MGNRMSLPYDTESKEGWVKKHPNKKPVCSLYTHAIPQYIIFFYHLLLLLLLVVVEKENRVSRTKTHRDYLHLISDLCLRGA